MLEPTVAHPYVLALPFGVLQHARALDGELVPAPRLFGITTAPPVIAQQLAAGDDGIGLLLDDTLHETDARFITLPQQLAGEYEKSHGRVGILRNEIAAQRECACGAIPDFFLEPGALNAVRGC